ncbi:MAG: DedA family protein [Candidatus Pacebacteria bacterium]|nr:DedA family protein [Candidatus Paceibacterota bacterium]
MHHFTVEHLTAIRLFLLLLQYGYLLLFPIAVIEGPVAAIVAGALVASGALNGYVVFAVLIVADLTGDMIYYSLGRWGHVHMVERISSRLGLTGERLKPLREEFHKNDWKVLLIGKTQGLGAIILYFAGATHMRLRKFLSWNLIGTLPKVLIFMLVGYLFGQSLLHSQRYFDYITFTTFGLGLFLLAAYWYFKRYMERNVGESLSEE